MKVVGFAGTGKNTGKTTALTAFLNAAPPHQELVLTSIGFDGEEIDNLSGLPKPRVAVRRGVWVATARRCLQSSEVTWEQVQETAITTALGPVVLARAVSDGRVVLAGPPHAAGLEELRRLVAPGPPPPVPGLGHMAVGPAPVSGLLLVDGAFSRLSPLGRADGLVLCTGAARAADPGRVAAEAAAVWRILSLPRWPAAPEAPVAGLFGEDQARQVVAVLQRGGCPRIDGLVTVSGLAHLQRLLRNMASARGHGEQARPPGRAILFRDPVQLLSAGEPTGVLRELDLMRAAGVESRVTGGPLLLAVCVNPFYPVRLPSGHFQAAFIDAELLRRTVAEALGQAATAANTPGMVPPVLDVRREGGAALCRAVMKQLGHGTAALA